MFGSVTEITPELLRKEGVRALILDVDNTLTLPDDQTVSFEIKAWLSDMKSHNIGLAIVSNNDRERIEPFAQKLGVMYICKARKPLPGGYRKALRLMSIPAEHAAVVGDQVYTDVLGARSCGMKAWLVEPFVAEESKFFRFKRRLEKKPIEAYRLREKEEQQ